MASLYTEKETNVRKTWLLFAVFLAVVVGIGWVFSRIYGNPGILYIAVIFSLAMNVGSYWFSDKIVLRMARAEPVEKKDAPELYNIVENLAITAGLPMPKVYLIDDPAPNAFATGRNAQHAVVAVTEGLLERLDHSELEGVIAHELSHVGNRDILLSTVVVVLVGSIAILSNMFLNSMRWGGMRRRDDRQQGGNAVFVLVGLALAVLAPIAATLMQLAISRKREFLADTSGALLTRYPEALASALLKISKDPHRLGAAQNSTAHLWLENPYKADSAGTKTPFLAKLFMTHPPVEERIKALQGLKV